MNNEIERVSRSKEQARKSYNVMSRWYDLFTSSEKVFTDIGIQMLGVQPDESVLEIGCGTGHALVEFTSKCKKVTAIDLSEKMLKVAQRKLQSKKAGLCQADGLFLPFYKEQFDNVFVSFTLELFDTPEIPKILHEIHRVLKDGGRLGVVSLAKQDKLAVQIYEWFHRQMPSFVDCRPIYLQPLLKESGVQIQESIIKKMWGLPVEIAVARK
jgi:demethylmenaquinone methyltransferase/2-methoxy-6-polyprenyl-1,4-benzoquinol methylase